MCCILIMYNARRYFPRCCDKDSSFLPSFSYHAPRVQLSRPDEQENSRLSFERRYETCKVTNLSRVIDSKVARTGSTVEIPTSQTVGVRYRRANPRSDSGEGPESLLSKTFENQPGMLQHRHGIHYNARTVFECQI
jgi:hypothetical protein